MTSCRTFLHKFSPDEPTHPEEVSFYDVEHFCLAELKHLNLDGLEDQGCAS